MCGIAGAVTEGMNSQQWRTTLHAMRKTVQHRGPDDQGSWHDADAGIGFAHSRLSIVDLSHGGHQPMVSGCGRYVVALNGEVYNFQVLRKELEGRGHQFRGQSDTEVMLAAFTEWGLHEGVERLVGMFAFSLWDAEERSLYLVRDRMGEKPLYYGWQDNAFLFSSELRAMRVHPAWRGEIDRDSLALLVQHDYIPAPHSIYAGIRKVEPGCIVRLQLPVTDRGKVPQSVAYWSVASAVANGRRHRFTGTDAEAVDRLGGLLTAAVANQMLADVPVGAFLSGGVDSSAVVALMQSVSSRPVKTFAIGFEQPEFDESHHASAVARHLGTDHTCLRVGPADVLSIVPKLASIYDEPLSDSSQIPTYLVSKLARESVTVSLSGDAGDELFAGYTRYASLAKAWDLLARVPMPVRRLAALGICTIPNAWWDDFFEALAPLLPRALRNQRFGGKTHAFTEILNVRSEEELHHLMISRWRSPTSVVIDARERDTALTMSQNWPHQDSFIERMMYLDMISYLPDDILAKVDRAAMAVSLETRVPLLDHRVVEFAWSLPLSLKIREGQSKWILRQVLYRHVPRKLIERPKRGFSVPLAHWLRGPLRSWAEAHLSQERLRSDGFFDASIVRLRWEAHIGGKANWETWLWNILVFQSWYEHWHLKP